MQDIKQQYLAIKTKYPDAVLFFRVGDFYEIFGNDAKLVATVLGTTVSETQHADLEFITRFPHYALDKNLHQLVKHGHRVAICEELQDPKRDEGSTKRGLTDLLK